jgi:hypothetical protein
MVKLLRSNAADIVDQTCCKSSVKVDLRLFFCAGISFGRTSTNVVVFDTFSIWLVQSQKC